MLSIARQLLRVRPSIVQMQTKSEPRPPATGQLQHTTGADQFRMDARAIEGEPLDGELEI